MNTGCDQCGDGLATWQAITGAPPRRAITITRLHHLGWGADHCRSMMDLATFAADTEGAMLARLTDRYLWDAAAPTGRATLAEPLADECLIILTTTPASTLAALRWVYAAAALPAMDTRLKRVGWKDLYAGYAGIAYEDRDAGHTGLDSEHCLAAVAWAAGLRRADVAALTGSPQEQADTVLSMGALRGLNWPPHVLDFLRPIRSES